MSADRSRSVGSCSFRWPVVERRAFVAGVCAALTTPSWSAANEWPAGEPVRIITPFPPGGATDALSRPISARLREVWKTDVPVVPRPGNNNIVAIDEVAKSAPDGRTLGLITSTLSTLPFLMPKLPFDPLADLAPVSLIARTASIVVVPAQSPIATVTDLIKAAKAADGKMRYVSSGLGTSFHLVAELFSRAADVRLTHVQKGSATETINALTAGEADVVFANAAAALPAVRNGHAKAVAVTASTRARYLPDVPAVAETLPGFEGSAWFGFFVTAKTPPDLLGRLRQDVGGAIRHPEVANSIRDAGAEPVGSTADELADVLRADLARWERIIREAGISPR